MDQCVSHQQLDSAGAMPLIERITAIADELTQEVTEGIPPEDLATAERVLRQIGDRLEKH